MSPSSPINTNLTGNDIGRCWRPPLYPIEDASDGPVGPGGCGSGLRGGDAAGAVIVRRLFRVAVDHERSIEFASNGVGVVLLERMATPDGRRQDDRLPESVDHAMYGPPAARARRCNKAVTAGGRFSKIVAVVSIALALPSSTFSTLRYKVDIAAPISPAWSPALASNR